LELADFQKIVEETRRHVKIKDDVLVHYLSGVRDCLFWIKGENDKLEDIVSMLGRCTRAWKEKKRMFEERVKQILKVDE